MRFIFLIRTWAIWTILLLVLVSCRMPYGRRQAEPRHIAILNQCDFDIYDVRISEVAGDQNQPVRLGSVSPLLAGRSYIIKRLPESKPLPPRARLEWKQHNRVTISEIVSIEDMLKFATGAEDEALLFTIFSSGHVEVSLMAAKHLSR